MVNIGILHAGVTPDPTKRWWETLSLSVLWLLVSKCLYLSVQSAGVTLEVNLRITQARKHARDPPWLSNPEDKSPVVINRDISGPTQRTSILQKLYKRGAPDRGSKWVCLLPIPKLDQLLILSPNLLKNYNSLCDLYAKPQKSIKVLFVSHAPGWKTDRLYLTVKVVQLNSLQKVSNYDEATYRVWDAT